MRAQLWSVLAQLFTIQALAAAGVQGLLPLAPFFKEEWHLGEIQVGLFTSAMYAGAAVLSIKAGQLADYLGERFTLFCGQAFIGAMVFLLGLSNTYPAALALMFMAGLGYSAVNPSTSRAIMGWFPGHIRGTAMGVKQMGVTIGSAAAAAVLPVIAVNTSWQTSLRLTGIAIIISSALFYIFYRKPECNQTPDPSRSATDLRRIVHNKSIVLLSLIMTLFTAVQLSFGTFLAVELTGVLHFSKITAAQYLALAHITGTLGRFTWGVISDVFFQSARKPVLYLISIITTSAAVSSAFISEGTPEWVILLIVAAFGFSAIGYNGIYLVFVPEIAGKELAGVSTGFTLSISFLGIILGTPFFGYLVEFYGSYTFAWLSLALLMLIGMLLLRFVAEPKKDKKK